MAINSNKMNLTHSFGVPGIKEIRVKPGVKIRPPIEIDRPTVKSSQVSLAEPHRLLRAKEGPLRVQLPVSAYMPAILRDRQGQQSNSEEVAANLAASLSRTGSTDNHHSKKTAVMECMVAEGGSYSGWDRSGYSIDRQDDSRIGKGSQLNRHVLTFVIHSRGGEKIEVQIEDVLKDRSLNASSIHNRNLRVVGLTDGLKVKGAFKLRKVENYPSRILFNRPNVEDIVEITLCGTDPRFAGLEIKLLVGCVERIGASRSYIHKKVIGLEISGQNPHCVNTWEAEFNCHRTRVATEENDVYLIEKDDTIVRFRWPIGEDPVPIDLPPGYDVVKDPLERCDYARIIRPEGPPLEIQLDPRKGLVVGQTISVISTVADQTWEIPVNGHGAKFCLERDGEDLAIRDATIGDFSYHVFSSDRCLILPDQTKFPGQQALFMYIRRDGRLHVSEIDIATFYMFEQENRTEGWESGFIGNLTVDSGTILVPVGKERPLTGLAKIHPWDERVNLSFIDEQLKVTVHLRNLLMQRSQRNPRHLDYSVVSGCALVGEGAHQRIEPVYFAESLISGKYLLVPGVGFYKIEALYFEDAHNILANHEAFVVIGAVNWEDINHVDIDLEDWSKIELSPVMTDEATESLIAGHPFISYAFPIQKFGFSKNGKAIDVDHARKMRVIERKRKTHDRSPYRFEGMPVMQMYPDMAGDDSPLWEVQLDLEFTGEIFIPHISTTTSDGVSIVPLRNFIYREAIAGEDGRVTLKQHRLRNIRAELVRAGLNWVLQFKFKGRTLYLQALRAPLDRTLLDDGADPEDYKTSIAAIGLQLSTELGDYDMFSRRAYQRIMLARGAFDEVQRARIRSEADVLEVIQPTVETEQEQPEPALSQQLRIPELQEEEEEDIVAEPVPNKAPEIFSTQEMMDNVPPIFEPGHELRADFTASKDAFMKALFSRGHQPLTLKLGDQQVTVQLYYDVDKRRYLIHTGPVMIGKVEAHIVEVPVQYAGEEGHYRLVDHTGAMYPIMCFQSEVFLHTTPVPLEEKIPKEVIHRWENAALDMYRRKTLYFAQAEEKEGGGPRLKLPSLSSKTVIQENAFGNIAKKDRIFIHYPDGSVLFFDVLNYNGAHNFDPNFLTIGFKGQGDDEFVVLENLVYLLSNRYTKGFSTIRFGYKGPKNIKGERNTILYLDLFFVLKGGIIFMVPFEMFRNHKGHLNTVDLQKKYRALMGQRRVIFAHSEEE